MICSANSNQFISNVLRRCATALVVITCLQGLSTDARAQLGGLGGFVFGKGKEKEEVREIVNLDIQSDSSDYDEILGIAKASGNVIVKYGDDITIEAGQVEYHKSSGKIYARDNVRVFRNGETIDAEEIIYDTKTGELTTSKLRSALEPIFFTSESIARPSEDSGGPITLMNSTFTTHDSSDPNYRVQVKKLTVYPDDRIVMEGAKVFVGDVPLVWLPFYVQPLNDELGFYFTPGWNSAWGGFLLNRYGFMVGDNVLAKAHLDVRTERGVAGGVEFKDQKFKDNDNIGILNLYYTEDSNPQRRFNGQNRLDDVDPSRYRVNFQQRVYFPGSDDETFYLDFDINRLSDSFIYEDFFPSEFRVDPRPDNVINLAKTFDQGEVSLTSRFQLNDFFQTDTRNELAVDIIRTPIGESGFFYEGMTTYGVIDEEFNQTDLIADPIAGYNRFQTYHEFLFPTQLGGFLNVVPRAGAGYANYSDFDLAGLNDFDSTTTHAGVDVSFKMSKSSPNVVNKALGINGLLHVVRPYMNYSLVRTDEIDGAFRSIDRRAPSTRLRPIDLPLYTAVDELRDWQVARFGVSNRWITKRDGQSYEWLTLNNYFDYYAQDPEFNRDFSNFYTEIDWRPVPWLSAGTTAQLPLFENQLDFTEVNSLVSFMPTDWFRFGVGHYFLTDHPTLPDSDLYSLTTYTRLSDDWGFSTSHRFESDDNTLEYQQYTVHKDLASWTASVGAIVRDNRDGENEYGVLLSLTLKAFPRVSLPVDFQPGGLGPEEDL